MCRASYTVYNPITLNVNILELLIEKNLFSIFTVVKITVKFNCQRAQSVEFDCQLAQSVEFDCQRAQSVEFDCQRAQSVEFNCQRAPSVEFDCQRALSVKFDFQRVQLVSGIPDMKSPRLVKSIYNLYVLRKVLVLKLCR